jgi:hypothetical protein
MKKHLFAWLLVGCTLCITLFATLAQDAPVSVLRVDAANALHEISPYVYGANHGPSFSFPTDMFPEAGASGITFLRFPAGRWGDENNIRPEQLDLFIIQCEIIGAEPSVHVRLENGTPEQAAELVRYANIEKGYDITYWAIGNEPNLFRDYSIEQLNTEWRAIAEAMLAVDPDIILMGPEISQYPPTPDDYHAPLREWVRAFVVANGDLVDIVTIHRYPFPQGQDVTTIEGLRRNTVEWDFIIPDLRAVVQEAAGRDIPVAVTEINSHWSNSGGGEAGMDSHYNAIWLGDVLGRLIKHDVEIVALFTFATTGNQGSWGLINGYNLRPTYYTYQLYQRFGTQLVESESNDADLTIYAALGEDGSLRLIVINLADDAKTAALVIDGFEAGNAAAEVWRFDPTVNGEQIESETLGKSITLPGQSITLYILAAN